MWHDVASRPCRKSRQTPRRLDADPHHRKDRTDDNGNARLCRRARLSQTLPRPLINGKSPMYRPIAAALLLTTTAAPARRPNRASTPRTSRRPSAPLPRISSRAARPARVGEERTIGYLIGRLQALLGLEPAGTGGGWTQPVPLLRTRLGTPTMLAFDRKGDGDAADLRHRHLSLDAPAEGSGGDRRTRRSSSSVTASPPPNAAGTISRARTSRARSRSS